VELYKPAGQQIAEPAALYVFAAQARQEVALVCARLVPYVPAAQRMHAEDLMAKLYEPGAHEKQMEPLLGLRLKLYFPVLQLLHIDAVSVYFPLGQSRHSAELVAPIKP
jgi:hypothetical protein